MPRVVLLLIAILLLGSGYGPPPIAQPTDYRSPSGEYRWHVDPDDRNAGAGARYTLYRDDARVLTRAHPFALRKAQVADDGTLGGYAYVAGAEPRDNGRFVVALVRTDGGAQVLTDAARRSSMQLHTDDDPKANGVFIDSVNALLTVRVHNPGDAGAESWWRYRLGDGTALAPINPSAQQSDNARLRHILYAQASANTGLTLVQWYTSDDRYEHAGTRVALLDSELNAVWSLDLDEEFAAFSTDQDKQLVRHIGQHGSVLDQTSAGFSIWQASTRERIDFLVTAPTAASKGWTVAEHHRAKHAGPATAPRPTALPLPPARTLVPLGRIELAVGHDDKPTLGEFDDFAIDDQGRFGLLRCGCEIVSSFQLVGADGMKVREIALDFMPTAQASTAHIAWIGGERWLLTFDDRKRSQAYWLDMDTGKSQPIADFDAPPIEALSADGAGGFVVLTQLFANSTMESSLRAFDSKGRLRWRIEEGHGSDSTIFSAEDVTVTSDGIVTVVENISKELKRFDRNGRALGAVKLEALWRREPNYPSGIEADASGGVIVFDFHGKPEVVRMRADHGVLAEFTPTLADSQRFSVIGNVQAAPDGRLWTSDGNALFRLTAGGAVDQVVGAAPGSDVIERIAAMQVTPQGRIYAADERSGAVHVFAADGARVQVCRPATGDYDGKLGLPSLTVTDSGEIYIERDGDVPDFLHYAADCKRLGVESLPFDTTSQDWFAQAGTTQRWVIGYQKLFQVDASGKLLTTIERTASGRWLDRPTLAAAAADGSLVVASDIGLGEYAAAPKNPVIAVYSSSGKALRDLPAPNGLVFWVPLAADGERVAFMVGTDESGDQRSVWVMDALSGASYRVANASTQADRVFLVRPIKDPELWVFDGKRGIDRFGL